MSQRLITNITGILFMFHVHVGSVTITMFHELLHDLPGFESIDGLCSV